MVTTIRGSHEVRLATYAVTIEPGVLDRIGKIVDSVARAHRYAIITDDNVGPLYAARIAKALHVPADATFTIPAGEAHKTRETWARLTDALLAAGFGRDTTIIALGGGVVGDLAGFVAATFMRGVPFVQVPTTLLAMIDASIGGKTGVDTAAGKNLVGAFHQPAAVVADTSVLATLPINELRAGMAEAIKHGVIADAAYFARIASLAGSLRSIDVASPAMLDLVARSVEIKADVVSRDERENGIRKILNFGHTIGHAVELVSEFSLLHGEAVAIGMVYEARIAERVGVADAGTAAEVQRVVRLTGLPDVCPDGLSVDAIVAATRGDKKARGGRAEYALPARIGAMAGASSSWGIAVSEDLVRDVLAG
jgi:3-dehydroquinate synthase